MVIAYVPAFTVVLLIVIVKPGPTVPLSVFAFVAANVELASASVARIVVSPMVIGRMRAPWLADGETCCVTTTASRRDAAQRIATSNKSLLRLSASSVSGLPGCAACGRQRP